MFLTKLQTLLQLGVFEDFLTHRGTPWGWGDTLVLTFAGFFIVFLVLLLLIVIFTVFGKIMEKANAKQAQKNPPAPAPTAAPTSAAEVDDETAAVIVAAITEATGGKKVLIKQIKEASEQ